MTSQEKVTRCEKCGSHGVPLMKYRVLRLAGEETSRVVNLCQACGTPLELLLQSIPRKRQVPLTVTPIEELKPSKTLRRQRGEKVEPVDLNGSSEAPGALAKSLEGEAADDSVKELEND